MILAPVLAFSAAKKVGNDSILCGRRSGVLEERLPFNG